MRDKLGSIIWGNVCEDIWGNFSLHVCNMVLDRLDVPIFHTINRYSPSIRPATKDVLSIYIDNKLRTL